MDILTQGLLGTALSMGAAKKDEIKKAGLIGLLSGLAADVDFFISSANDPLLNLEYHRHFTHSVFFIPVAALILSFLFWPLFKKYLTWNRIFIFSLLGYSFSGFLDACTSYGTTLFWPLSDQRISLNIISIIDPIFTLILLLGIIISLKTRKKILLFSFLLLCAAYLFLGWFQHQRVEAYTQNLASQRGHQINNLLVKPTLGNHWLWRSIYLHEETYYIDAIRLNPFSGTFRLFEGESITRFKASDHAFNIPADSILQKDIDRFSHFTNGYLALDPKQDKTIIDVRYSNLPNTTSPLWAIQIDPQKPGAHADYRVTRDTRQQTRDTFLDMLFGRGY